nr:unnamed protein product [Digitaria exilis]
MYGLYYEARAQNSGLPRLLPIHRFGQNYSKIATLHTFSLAGSSRGVERSACAARCGSGPAVGPSLATRGTPAAAQIGSGWSTNGASGMRAAKRSANDSKMQGPRRRWSGGEQTGGGGRRLCCLAGRLKCHDGDSEKESGN